jgi:NYN domain
VIIEAIRDFAGARHTPVFQAYTEAGSPRTDRRINAIFSQLGVTFIQCYGMGGKDTADKKIITDMWKFYAQYKFSHPECIIRVILITGDRDFADAIGQFRNLGVEIGIITGHVNETAPIFDDITLANRVLPLLGIVQARARRDVEADLRVFQPSYRPTFREPGFQSEGRRIIHSVPQDQLPELSLDESAMDVETSIKHSTTMADPNAKVNSESERVLEPRPTESKTDEQSATQSASKYAKSQLPETKKDDNENLDATKSAATGAPNAPNAPIASIPVATVPTPVETITGPPATDTTTASNRATTTPTPPPTTKPTPPTAVTMTAIPITSATAATTSGNAPTTTIPQTKVPKKKSILPTQTDPQVGGFFAPWMAFFGFNRRKEAEAARQAEEERLKAKSAEEEKKALDEKKALEEKALRKKLEEEIRQKKILQEKRRLEEKRLEEKRLEEKRLEERLEEVRIQKELRLAQKQVEEIQLSRKRLEEKRLFEKRQEEKRLDAERIEESRLLDEMRAAERRLEEKRQELAKRALKKLISESDSKGSNENANGPITSRSVEPSLAEPEITDAENTKQGSQGTTPTTAVSILALKGSNNMDAKEVCDKANGKAATGGKQAGGKETGGKQAGGKRIGRKAKTLRIVVSTEDGKFGVQRYPAAQSDLSKANDSKSKSSQTASSSIAKDKSTEPKPSRTSVVSDNSTAASKSSKGSGKHSSKFESDSSSNSDGSANGKSTSTSSDETNGNGGKSNIAFPSKEHVTPALKSIVVPSKRSGPYPWQSDSENKTESKMSQADPPDTNPKLSESATIANQPLEPIVHTMDDAERDDTDPFSPNYSSRRCHMDIPIEHTIYSVERDMHPSVGYFLLEMDHVSSAVKDIVDNIEIPEDPRTWISSFRDALDKHRPEGISSDEMACLFGSLISLGRSINAKNGRYVLVKSAATALTRAQHLADLRAESNMAWKGLTNTIAGIIKNKPATRETVEDPEDDSDKYEWETVVQELEKQIEELRKEPVNVNDHEGLWRYAIAAEKTAPNI